MSDDIVCPCDVFLHPRPIHNAARRRTIAYRVGDYASFREALLRGLPGEQQLQSWQPSPDGDDLGLQLLEWWAYLADILTFYNERIANDTYLFTARRREVVARIVALLGYRPRPALAGSGKLAAMVSAKAAIQVPKGLGIQSKPSPGKAPLVFEIDKTALASPPGALDVDFATDTLLSGSSVLLRGPVSGVKAGDQLLLVQESWTPSFSGYAWLTVKSLSQEKDPWGKPNTRITFTSAPALPAGTPAKSCRLLRSTRKSLIYQTAKHVISVVGNILFNAKIHLASLVRDVAVGDWIVLETGSTHYLARVTKYAEVVWYENADSNPEVPPSPPDPPFPVPHTVIDFEPLAHPFNSGGDYISQFRVLYGLTDVGDIIDEPVTSAQGPTFTLLPRGPVPAAIQAGAQVFLEDAAERGLLGKVVSNKGGAITITVSDAATALKAPVRVLCNLLPVSQGKTVTGEILGSGDATIPLQGFTLKNAPLTYFAGGGPDSTVPYRSSLHVSVNGVPWKEVDNFVDQPAGARVYLTREDAAGKTHVLFGDGINGARLPTGQDNVVASYRYGAGGDAPGAGALTTLLSSVPGLSSVRNPVAVSGGEDAEPPEQMARYAPLSTFAFGRAISLDDHEAIAVSAGARRAKAYYAWDVDEQKALVKVYVGDDDSAVETAKLALARAVDPNMPFTVLAVTPQAVRLGIALSADAAYDRGAVEEDVRAALLDLDGELFGAAAQIGGAVYESQIAAVAMGVSGVTEVQRVVLAKRSSSAPQVGDTEGPGIPISGASVYSSGFGAPSNGFGAGSTSSGAPLGSLLTTLRSRERYSPGEGGVFTLADEDLMIAFEGVDHALGR